MDLDVSVWFGCQVVISEDGWYPTLYSILLKDEQWDEADWLNGNDGLNGTDRLDGKDWLEETDD